MPRGGVEVQLQFFHNLGAVLGVGGQRHPPPPATLLPKNIAGTRMDWCEIF